MSKRIGFHLQLWKEVLSIVQDESISYSVSVLLHHGRETRAAPAMGYRIRLKLKPINYGLQRVPYARSAVTNPYINRWYVLENCERIL